jgi:hypothetical protein
MLGGDFLEANPLDRIWSSLDGMFAAFATSELGLVVRGLCPPFFRVSPYQSYRAPVWSIHSRKRKNIEHSREKVKKKEVKYQYKRWPLPRYKHVSSSQKPHLQLDDSTVAKPDPVRSPTPNESSPIPFPSRFSSSLLFLPPFNPPSEKTTLDFTLDLYPYNSKSNIRTSSTIPYRSRTPERYCPRFKTLFAGETRGRGSAFAHNCWRCRPRLFCRSHFPPKMTSGISSLRVLSL